MVAAGKAIALGVALLCLLVVALTVGGGEDCAASADAAGGGGQSLTAGGAGGDRAIPSPMRRLYVRVARESGVPAPILAAVGYVETRHGRVRATSTAGAQGPMQFLPSTWRGLRCPGSIQNARDAVRCAARYLKVLAREPGRSGDTWQYAMCRYNGGCRPGVPAEAGYGATGQVAMSVARAYGYRPGQSTVLAAETAEGSDLEGCGEDEPAGSIAAGADGRRGSVRYLPTANRPGVPVTPPMREHLALVAGRLGRPITVCSGTNHRMMSSSGNVSDHWSGNGADICSSANRFPIASHGDLSSGGSGNDIATASLVIAGVPRARARSLARVGGLCDVHTGRQRVQVIWKTRTGGDHYDHIHIGVKRVSAPRGVRCMSPTP